MITKLYFGNRINSGMNGYVKFRMKETYPLLFQENREKLLQHLKGVKRKMKSTAWQCFFNIMKKISCFIVPELDI